MSKIKNNSLLQAISGKLGETHAYRKVRGKMYMVNLPEKGRELRDDQKAFISRFQKAASYASAQMEDRVAKAMYQNGVTAKKHSAYVVAVSDFLNAPQVNEIKTGDYLGAVGDPIKVDATDDFKVTRVRVIIRGADGNELERGEAIQDAKTNFIWRYTATVANPSVAGSKISVTAFDTPENETTMERAL